jgi:hypothetical protein
MERRSILILDYTPNNEPSEGRLLKEFSRVLNLSLLKQKAPKLLTYTSVIFENCRGEGTFARDGKAH